MLIIFFMHFMGPSERKKDLDKKTNKKPPRIFGSRNVFVFVL